MLQCRLRWNDSSSNVFTPCRAAMSLERNDFFAARDVREIQKRTMSGVAKPSAQEQCDNSRLRAVRAFCMATLRQLRNNFVQELLCLVLAINGFGGTGSQFLNGASACSNEFRCICQPILVKA